MMIQIPARKFNPLATFTWLVSVFAVRIST
jgi:hypothetical protein